MTEYVLAGVVAVLIADRYKHKLGPIVSKLKNMGKKEDNSYLIQTQLEIVADMLNKHGLNIKDELNHIKGQQQDLRQTLLSLQRNPNEDVYIRSLDLLTKASAAIIERQEALEKVVEKLTKALTRE